MKHDNLAYAFFRYGMCIFYSVLRILEICFDLLIRYITYRRTRNHG